MAGMALPSVLRLFVFSTLALNWYGASGAAVVIGREVEEVNYHPRRERDFFFFFFFWEPRRGRRGRDKDYISKRRDH